MFYLKYRPKKISELDNTAVKDIIKKVLESKNLPHALLFVGQKGTGKTSTARIFAKAVNCLNNSFFSTEAVDKTSKKTALDLQNIEPCNECKNCLAVDTSSSPDVIELDAASNRGIEDVRNLIKESNFYPMTNRYRVYIIDEAHMITPDAFNALLKTLEEPPSSVIFILATTNLEKIPKTIRSRCFLINFSKAKRTDIISMLNKIIAKEKIKIDASLVKLIAQYADFSFRDAAKILEELSIQNLLNLDDGKKYLGLLQENFLETILKKDLKESLSWINEFGNTGGNFKHLIEQLLEELRLLLMANNGIKNEDAVNLEFETREIVILMKLLTEAYNNLKISPIESLPLEIAVVEFYNVRKSKVESL